MGRRTNGGVVAGLCLVAGVGLGASAGATTGHARDLILTPSVRARLVAAGAKSHGLTSKDYLGLDKGTSYYAYDVTTKTYYAAAGLYPSPHSMKAEVSSQDDGGYLLFVRPASATTWRAYNDGLGGTEGARCPIVVPAAVLAVWNWRPGTCYPHY